MCVCDDKKWYAVRVTYSRELKFQALLQESGFQTFVPMTRRAFERKGKKEIKLVPAVSNLCFVNAVRSELDDFMKISLALVDDVLYLQEITPKLREGLKVRVKTGPFAGVEGTIIRVKRSRRVMVELPGMLAIATTFVKAEELEIL